MEEFLKELMIETQVWNQPDVLGYFNLEAPGLDPGANGLAVRLTTRGSGYGFSLDCTPASDGEPDAAGIVETLARVFRHVFRLSEGKEVFSSAQANDLLARAKAWAGGLMKEAGVVIPRAEVDLETAQWVESSLGLWVKVYSDREDKYALLVPVGKQGKPDFSGVEKVAARIARDWGGRVGLTDTEWLCVKMSAEIGPDAGEYVKWILEEEAKLLAEFFDAMNRELAGHLKDAEELHRQAVKWRADFDAWTKARGGLSLKIDAEGSLGVGADITAQIPELPGELKSSFTKIWEGLCKLPGQVKKGLEGKTGEIAKGLEFGFRAAWEVLWEAKGMAVEAVFKAWFWARFDALAQAYLVGKFMLLMGEQKANFSAHTIMLIVDRLRTVCQIDEQTTKLVDTTNKLNKIILKIRGEIYLSDESDKK